MQNLLIIIPAILVTLGIIFLVWISIKVCNAPRVIPAPPQDYQIENIQNIAANGFAKEINNMIENNVIEVPTPLMDAEEARKLADKAIQEAVEVFDPEVAKAIKEAALKGEYYLYYKIPKFDKAREAKVLFLKQKGYDADLNEGYLSPYPREYDVIRIYWYPKKSNAEGMIL